MNIKQQPLTLLPEPSPANGDISTGQKNGSTPVVSGHSRIDAALAELQQARIRSMSARQAEETLGTLSRISSITASLMHDITTMLNKSEHDAVDVLRHGARLPTRESKRLAKVGKQLEAMPQVKERLASGDITPDHAKALATAAEKVGPQVVEADEGLLEAADRMLPDSFNRHARRWADRKQIEAGINILERQKQSREAKLWVEKETGLGVLMAKMPRPQYELVRQAVDYHYLQHLRQDSTDNRDPDAVRSPKQRLHDVLFELITNRDADTGEFLPEAVGVKAKAATQLIIVADLDVIDGTNPDGVVEMLGVGPVPPQIFNTFTDDTQIAGVVYGKAGRILWLGHNQRLGNAAQRLAVAIRDRGCFQCGAPMHRCELHHIREWQRDGGPTDIDNLVAVCRKHHRMLEVENLRVVRTPDGYQTRPRDRPG